MKVVTKDNKIGWIYWPEQCNFCKGYHFLSENNKPCDKEKMKEFITKLLDLEHCTKGVYGSLEFKCDYFNLDDEKYTEFVQGQCCCPG